MTDLADYQRDIAAALRSQSEAPFGLAESRFQVYRRLVYNNLTGFIDQCYPIASALIGDEDWHNLSKAFFAEGKLHSPLFKNIPEIFLDWIEERDNVPEWLHDLMHYEWLELAAYQHTGEVVFHEGQPLANLEQGDIDVIVNPTVHFGIYPRPVHQFSPDAAIPPTSGEWFGVAVYRKASHEVAFNALNATTLQLLQALQLNPSIGAACQSLSERIPNTDAKSLWPHVVNVLEQLHQEQIILGYQRRTTSTG